mgnify:FL=1
MKSTAQFLQRKNPYRRTVRACYLGYVSQAIVCCYVPLLFTRFQQQYGIPLYKITALITVCFVLQLFVDFAAAFFVDKIGYRVAAAGGNAFTALGLCTMTFLPEILPDPFTGLLLSVLIYSTGAGLLEVVVSPIVEACPSDNKEGTMSLLHSFFCWGCVAVVVLSTVFFGVFGIQNWKILSLLWALIPLFNTLNFLRVPMCSLSEEDGEQLSLGGLLKNRLFWLIVLLMICAGACEQGISQWSSTFVEKALDIPKVYGDLAGPAVFSTLMGTSRALYGKFSRKLPLAPALLMSSLLCVASYCLIAFSQNPILSLFGIALCGFSVGIMWPGTFSLAAASVKGGSAMFAFLALAGDLGCSAGPTFVGMVAGSCGDNLRVGVAAGLVFPIGMAVLAVMRKTTEKKREK